MIPLASRGFRKALYSTTANPVFSSGPQKVVVQRLGMRSGILGFALGVSLAGVAAFEYLLDDYKGASHTLLMGVEGVAEKTAKMHKQVARIDDLRVKVDKIPLEYLSKKDAAELRRELLKAIDVVHLETLDLKLKLWELEESHSSKKSA